jgi:hypothetical protein
MARPRKSAARPAWPTLDKQLAAAKVVHGSPLHEFIQENQDFSLLRREEANDDLGLPLWIRVYWRRLHPEEEFPADDPTGGYPLSLREVAQAMLRDQEWPARVPRPKPGKRTRGTSDE